MRASDLHNQQHTGEQQGNVYRFLMVLEKPEKKMKRYVPPLLYRSNKINLTELKSTLGARYDADVENQGC